ncbi:MAG: hypothetical protein L0H03_10905, partial [Rhodococcus sp. (in: high G+C Gram-positive bacteria)]|nr:hypothetical protein [Rhodococcus sp. (in: high G+C Gram-positive bacteria)]
MTLLEAPARPRRRVRPSRTDGGIQWGIWLLVLLFIFGPIIPVVYAGFVDRPLYEDGGVLTLSNFSALLGDSAFWAALRNTALFAVMA